MMRPILTATCFVALTAVVHSAEDVEDQLIEIEAMIEDGGARTAYRPLTQLHDD